MPKNQKMKPIGFQIPIHLPYDWDYIYTFLKNHGVHGMEDFQEGSIQRNFRISQETGSLEVSLSKDKTQFEGKIWLTKPLDSIMEEKVRKEIIGRLQNLLDTKLDPNSHAFQEEENPDVLANLYQQSLGIRIPGAFSPYETAITIILGQLISVEQARIKFQKLLEQYGEPIVPQPFQNCPLLFPAPSTLAGAGLEYLGITRIRSAAIRELSRKMADKELDLESPGQGTEIRKALRAIPGIGAWTVEMIALRCLGDRLALPRTDLIIQRALALYKLEKSDWGPKNAYISLAIWKRYALELSQKGKKSTG